MSVNIVLTAFESSFTLSTSGAIPAVAPALTSDATIHLTFSVPATTLQNTFFYRTDQQITSDASFVYYYVDMSKWPDASTTLNPQNGTVVANSYAANDNIGKDFLRDLAKQLFGTPLAADLFTNEDEVVAEISLYCSLVAGEIVALLKSIDIKDGSFAGISIDSSGNKYMADNTSAQNISREVFNVLISNSPTRFDNIKTEWSYNGGVVDDGFYKMPIIPGDLISFKITVSPAPNQSSIIPTGPASLLPRSYTVILHAI